MKPLKLCDEIILLENGRVLKKFTFGNFMKIPLSL